MAINERLNELISVHVMHWGEQRSYIPDFSGNIAAAELVVDALAASGVTHLSLDIDRDSYTVRFNHGPASSAYYLPEAICRAALAHLGIEVPNG